MMWWKYIDNAKMGGAVIGGVAKVLVRVIAKV